MMKSAPPLTVVAATVAGFDLDVWIKIATIIYVVLQIAHLLFVRSWRNKKGDE